MGYTVEAPYTMDVHEGWVRVGESSERDNDYNKSKNKVKQQFKELSYDQTVQLLVKSFKYRLAELESQKKRFISLKNFIDESAYLKESTDINFNNNLYEGLRFLEKRMKNINCSDEERKKHHHLEKCSFYNEMIISAQEYSKNAFSCLKIFRNNAEVLSMIEHYNYLKSAKGCTVK